MKKALILLFVLQLVTFSSYSKLVRFQVNMLGQSVNPNGVRIAGDFQAAAGLGNNWNPSSTVMTNSGGGSIYSVTVNIPAGRFYEYKFINGNYWNLPGGSVEGVPALVQVGHPNNGGSNGNRWAFIDSTSSDTLVLPAVLFGGVAPLGKIAVRFSVDLQNEGTISNEGIFLAGQFTNWFVGQRRMANLFSNNKIYEFIAVLDSGATYDYKFKNGNFGWESVPSACATNGNRRVIADGNKALGKVFLGSCPLATLPRYNASFIVDMSNSACFGGFDSVTVAGSRTELTNWGSGVKLTRQGTSNIYSALIPLDSGEVEFKFRFHKNGNTNWEFFDIGGNRMWSLAASDTLDLTCFGSLILGACLPQPPPSTITFRVDLSSQVPDPWGKIYVMGNFLSWQDTALKMLPVAGPPGLYEVTVNNVCPASFSYKFINGDPCCGISETFPDTNSHSCLVPDNLGGFRRTYKRTTGNPVVLGFKFNMCDSIVCGKFATVTPAGTTAFCQGDSIVINANTGSGLTYRWQNANGMILGATSPSFTATSSGIYRAIVSNVSGCVDTSSAVNVIVNSTPTAKAIAMGSTSFCQGKSVVISVDTGLGLTYYWRDSITGNIPNATLSRFIATTSGVYKVIVRDVNGCSDSSSSIIVNVNPSPIASAVPAGPTVFCEGNSVLINTNSGTSLNYQWLNDTVAINGATASSYLVKSTGTYRVVQTNLLNCSDTSEVVQVTVNSNPNAGPMLGDSFYVKTSLPYVYSVQQQLNHTYNWIVSNGIIFSGQNTNAATVQWLSNGSGAVKVVVTNPQGCTDTTSKQVTIGNIGLNDLNNLKELMVYPNPSNGTFAVSFNALKSSTVEMSLVNLLGQQIWSENRKINQGENEIKINTELLPGIYSLRMTSISGEIINKILIQ